MGKLPPGKTYLKVNLRVLRQIHFEIADRLEKAGERPASMLFLCAVMIKSHSVAAGRPAADTFRTVGELLEQIDEAVTR